MTEWTNLSPTRRGQLSGLYLRHCGVADGGHWLPDILDKLVEQGLAEKVNLALPWRITPAGIRLCQEADDED